MTNSSPPFYLSPLLSSIPWLRHGFFTQTHPFLKASTQEQIELNKKTLKDCALQLNPNSAKDDAILICNQIHSPICVEGVQILANPPYPHLLDADAILLEAESLGNPTGAGVLTADCGPVLFADRTLKIAACAHAGWKGAFDGVLSSTVTAMQEKGSELKNIVACIGPSIAQNSYEIGPEFYERFISHDPYFSTFFEPNQNESAKGFYFFNLRGFITHQLKTLGLKDIDHINIDTYQNRDQFSSYRRSCHDATSPYRSNQISAVYLI